MKDKLYFIKCISGSWNFRTGKGIRKNLIKISLSFTTQNFRGNKISCPTYLVNGRPQN